MLKWLVANALRQRVLVLFVAVVLVIVGVRASKNVSLDVFPEFAPPMVEIQTEAPGLSTEEVESLVTVPLEAGVYGVPGMKTMRSKSVLGLSSLVLIFEDDFDVLRARQLVQERVAAAAPRLPAGVRPPTLLPPLSATSRALKIGMSSSSLDAMSMSEIARWTVRPKLMGVPGVANVAIWGLRDRQLQVLVDPARLAAIGVTLAEVQQAAADAVVVTGGGFVDTPNQRIAVRHPSFVQTPEDLARAVVKLVDGAPVRLGDVAEVVEGHAAPIGSAIINERDGLLLIVEKQQGANTLEVTRGVEKAIADLKPGLQGIDIDSSIFRPATFIERSLSNLAEAMWLGCALVALVLLVFTRDWRSAAISLSAIPLSLLAAVLVMIWTGQTLNTMVIAGLVIALGEIVDDAIIDVENIGRRWRENRLLPRPKPAFNVVLAASLEVRGAVVFASLIVMLVFLPIFFLDGVAGTFFRPLATAYILAIGASLLVALTVTPALCLILLPRLSRHTEEPRWVRALKRGYRAILPAVVGRPELAMGAVAGGLLIAGIGYSQFDNQFLPDFRETDFLMHFVEKPGTSLEAMERITKRASGELRAIPGVRNFGSHIGRAESGDEVYGPHFTELWISLDEQADYDASVKKIQDVIDGYPGLYRDVLTYLRERIKEVLTGAGATIVVRIFGPEVDGLRMSAEAVKAAIASIPGVSDLKVEQQSLIPQIHIRLKPDALAAHGLTAGEVRRAVTTVVQASKVGEIYRDQKIFDVSVWGTPDVRNDLSALRQLQLSNQSGAQVPLESVADVSINPAANEIKRENGSRRIDVTMNLKGTDLGRVARDVEARVRGLEFARGYYPEFLGEYSALRASQRQLMVLGGLCLIGVLFLVWLEFRSLRMTALLAATLPCALLGGVVAVALSGGVMSLGSLVGFVTVFGITARNSLMLLSHYRHLVRNEGEVFGLSLVLRGAEERVVPILMTASCAALALLPLVARGDLPGHEIEYPMAVVILGGLVSSTALNLLLMPALYARFGNKASKRDSKT
ncbi:efflux RND transporter permease subunit [Paraburkholderia sp. MMS20-SJTR3]|uniref:Efflux RND transporter permease subunit n=1 Tax=Paraburkholderia sejongensis TaxID=2886946 RepID=A0ABS8JSH1_9BURK|nr:efflux RND transporter permease subunit [Paraburkholderia sp. MMS20-SJTR3]MCC8392841.1 efflux RND transporter permease subunit [Paraburkholderia sp. MMS20-SJTR3]